MNVVARLFLVLCYVELRRVAHDPSLARHAAGPQFEDLERVAAAELVAQAVRPCRYEPEPGVIVRLAEDHGKVVPEFLAAAKAVANEAIGDTASPKGWLDSDRTEACTARTAGDGDRTERDMPDDATVVYCDERHRQPLRLAERIDQARLERRRERGGVDLVDALLIGRILRAEGNNHLYLTQTANG
jgi:hypothetical protein